MGATVKRGRRVKKSRVERIWLLMVAVITVLMGLAFFGLRNRAAGETTVDRAGALCVVCIDPGHGGSDQGTSWEGRLEKDDNLDMALALREALTEQNIYAVLTREEDTGLTLEERVAFAEAQQADYFISLHRNYADVSACGIEVWVAENCSATALALAQQVEQGLVSVGAQNDRGVRSGSQSGEGDYYVLSHTTMPAILIELGFIQDQEDNQLLDQNSKAYAQAIAAAVASVAADAQSD